MSQINNIAILISKTYWQAYTIISAIFSDNFQIQDKSLNLGRYFLYLVDRLLPMQVSGVNSVCRVPKLGNTFEDILIRKCNTRPRVERLLPLDSDDAECVYSISYNDIFCWASMTAMKTKCSGFPLSLCSSFSTSDTF